MIILISLIFRNNVAIHLWKPSESPNPSEPVQVFSNVETIIPKANEDQTEKANNDVKSSASAPSPEHENISKPSPVLSNGSRDEHSIHVETNEKKVEMPLNETNRNKVKNTLNKSNKKVEKPLDEANNNVENPLVEANRKFEKPIDETYKNKVQVFDSSGSSRAQEVIEKPFKKLKDKITYVFNHISKFNL